MWGMSELDVAMAEERAASGWCGSVENGGERECYWGDIYILFSRISWHKCTLFLVSFFIFTS
jgi:hypothetical protein